MDFFFGIIVGAGACGLVFLSFNVFRASEIDELEEKIRADAAERAAKLKAAEQKLRSRLKR